MKNVKLETFGKEDARIARKEIKALSIKNISMNDSALFMWTTDAHLKYALEVIEAWGFKYKTVAFVWRKISNKGNQLSTLGAWTMKNCELCLLATSGKMLQYKKSNSVKQLIEAERNKHSAKPIEAVLRIEALFGKCKRLELFARAQRSGWDSWGNEV